MNDNYHCKIEQNPEDIPARYTNGRISPAYQIIFPSQMPSRSPGTFSPTDVFNAIDKAGVPFLLFLNSQWLRHVGREFPNFCEVFWDFERTKATRVQISPVMQELMSILGEGGKVVTPLEFAISASAHRRTILRSTHFTALPLVSNSVSQVFGEVVLLRKGAIWAIPAFDDNARACLTLLSSFTTFQALQNTLLNQQVASPKVQSLAAVCAETKEDSSFEMRQQTGSPTAFISYSWDDEMHREWVRALAERLRSDGVDVTLDRWATVPGDQLPAFMERAIRENQFVVIICTPRYKKRSDAREGGVGYEGDIMTGEVKSEQNIRKFIPVLRSGAWSEAAPSWLAGRYYIDLRGDPYLDRQYKDLACTLLGIRETAPPIGKPMTTFGPSPQVSVHSDDVGTSFEDIKITRVIVEDIAEPRNDGSRGFALYAIPFALSRRPPSEWTQIFVWHWDHPPRYSTLHRPGIARVNGSTVTLDGTTIEEVERVHRDTLQLVLNETNRRYREWHDEQERLRTHEQAEREERQRRIDEAAKRIRFD